MSKARDLADTVSTGGILDDGTVSVSEISDLTVTAAELNNVAGVNSDVQTQLDLKAPLASPTFTGTVTASALTVAASTSLVKLEDTDTNAYAQIATDGSGIVNIAADEGNTGASPRITFDVSTTERMRIDSSGNVGIGATSSFGKMTINSNGAPASSGNMSTGLTIANGTAGTAINIGTNDAGAYNYIQSGYVNNADAARNLVFFSGASEAFRFGTSGELGIGGATYGTAGQVLTSGGSGAAPTWADAAGGATITATADGAISAGDAVSLQSNGTVKKTQETVTDLGTPALINNYTVGGLGGPGFLNQPAMGYFPSNGFIHYIYMYSSNAYIRRGTYNTTNGEIENLATLDAQGANNWDGALTAAFNPSNNTFALLVMDTSTNLKLYIYYSKSDGSASSAAVTVSSAAYSGDQSACVVCNQDTGNYHVYFVNTNTNSIRGSIYSPTIGAAPNYNVSITTVSSFDLVYNSGTNNNDRHLSVAKDESTTDSFLLVHKRASDDSMQADYFTHTSSGVSNVGSMLYQTGTTSGTQFTAMAYNVEDAKFVVTTNFNGNAYLYTLVKPSSAGGAPTASSAVTYSNQGTEGSTRLIYDPKVKDVIVKWWHGGSSEIRAARVDSSGSTPSVGTHVNVYSTNGSGYLLSDITYLSNHNKFFALERDTSQGHRTVSIQTSTTSTNNTKWIGFASEAIADTASGDILVVGSTDENQSGLTIGSTYYVQPDGSLATTTTDAIKAGKAIAATKLLITEGNA